MINKAQSSARLHDLAVLCLSRMMEIAAYYEHIPHCLEIKILENISVIDPAKILQGGFAYVYCCRAGSVKVAVKKPKFKQEKVI